MTIQYPPESWQASTVADLCKMQNGYGFGPDDWDSKGLPIIRIQNLNGGKVFDYFSGIPDPRWIVEPGQLLFSWAGTKGVSFGPFIWRGPRGVLNQHIFKVLAYDGVDIKWLYWALKDVTSRIEAQAHGFKATLVHVKKSDIDRQQVLVPIEAEQRRIASVLATWDQAIITSEKLLANALEQMEALGRKLFSAANNWEIRRLNELATRVQRKAIGGNYPVLMISSSIGFVRQDEKYSRFMAGKSVGNYTLLEKGEFAYNKGNSKRYEFGCVFPLEGVERGLVPHVYVCFKFNDSCSPQFFKHLFKSDYLRDQLGGIVNTGVRNNGLLNIRPNDFMGVSVPLPPIQDQYRIASVLDSAEALVTAERVKLERLRLEKSTVMSILLTGKRRFSLASSPLAEAAS